MISIFGATGPTGFHLARELLARGKAVRAISRSRDHLARRFAGLEVETVAADATDAQATLGAIEGSELVYDCIGLTGEHMHLHPVTAANIAQAIGRTGARCIQVSSSWAYLPLTRTRIDETHPREGGGPWVRFRREAEDVLQRAGAAILHLPDFYGPEAHTGPLQQALAEAAAGRAMNWVGGADVGREYIYAPDAAALAARVADHARAFGERWMLPGAGPLSGREVAEIAGKHLDRTVKLRAAGPQLLRLVSLVKPELRGFMQMVPDYVKPVAYDASKLRGLIGDWTLTPYDEGIPQTLDWIAASRRSA